MPLLHWNGISKLTPTQLYESSRIDTRVKWASAVALFMTFLPVVLMNMKLNQSSTQQRNFELKRPNPPSPEAVKRAQPFRGDTLKELEAVIKNPQAINVE